MRINEQHYRSLVLCNERERERQKQRERGIEKHGSYERQEE